MVAKGQGMCRRKDGEFRISRCKLIHRMDKQRGPPIYENCIQYPVVSHHGKSVKRMCIIESLCSTADINTVNPLK